MADPTPEDRAAELMKDVISYHLNTTPLVTLHEIREIREEITKAIREAEASARSKAFEEAAEICSEGLKLEGPPPVIRAAMAVTGKCLARKIRARAREAPRGS